MSLVTDKFSFGMYFTHLNCYAKERTMTSAEMIQNWKNEDSVMANPAGLVELNDSDLAIVDGGTTPVCIITVIVTITLLPTPAY